MEQLILISGWMAVIVLALVAGAALRAYRSVVIEQERVISDLSTMVLRSAAPQVPRPAPMRDAQASFMLGRRHLGRGAETEPSPDWPICQ